MAEKKNRFSGYGVLAGCLLLMIFPGGLLTYTMGLYMYPICVEFGFSMTAFAITTTVSAGVNALVSAFLVQYLQKGSKNTMKLIMLAAAVLTCGGYAMLSQCSTLWQFYLMSAVWNLGYNMLTYVPVSMMISNWFVEKRAMMTGVAFAGGNLGGAIFNTVISRLIADQGWRYAYLFGGLLSLVFTAIAIIFLLKRSPEEYGQKALGADNADVFSQQNASVGWEGVDKATAMRSPAIWLMAVIMFFTGIYSAGIASHVVTFLCNSGWEITAAGVVMTVYTLAGVVGNSGGGALVGKIGLKKGVIFGGILSAVALLCLILSGANHIFAYLFAVLLGVACIFGVLIPSQMVGVTFGMKDYAGIYGFVYAFYLVGCAVSSPAIAIVAENVNYRVAWIAVIVMVVAIVAMYIKCFDYAKKFKEQSAKQ